MPLWLKYVLTLVVFVPAVVFGAIWLHDRTGAPPPEVTGPTRRAGQAAMAQDQAVHRAAQPASVAPSTALQRAILGDVQARIASHDLTGPAGSVSGHPLASDRAGRLAFRCRAVAGGVNYPFMGVADVRTRTLAWCKDDNIPVAGSLRVRLSAACT